MAAKSAVDTATIHREWLRFYDKTLDWVTEVGPRLISAAVVLGLGLWLISMIRSRVKKRMGKPDIHHSLRPFLESLIFTLLHVGLIFLVLQILGVKLTVFAAVIAAFGAAAGFALSGTLQNFASGILILLLKPFKTGDNIIAQGEKGTVTAIQIFYTVINTFDNRTVIMPNSKLSNEVIINITREGIRRLDIELKFKYSDDIHKVKEILRQAFIDFPEALNEPKPRIGVTAIEAKGYKLMCNVWVNAHGFEDMRMTVNEKIIGTLIGAGIELAE